ncbi:hypothetical protein SPONN_2079 [uncultured Candidatus Thioglobus sp.]|nr:hypothetical protein SPONN_2079 [uncultured Candidatus Thioglobus sp.]
MNKIVKVEKKGKKYCLIENQSQIDERVRGGDFSYCIFLCDANFQGINFTQDANFMGVNFTQNADFEDATFVEYADFSQAIFTQKANFSLATFKKNAFLSQTVFTKDVNFSQVIFTENAYFSEAKFKDEVIFYKTIFTQDAFFQSVLFIKDAEFALTTFDRNAHFSNTTFTQLADFLSAKIQGVLNLGVSEVAKLNLQLTTVDRIAYGDIKFNADNRETFLTLKNVALKKNDQIRALEFHQQEYQTHFKNIKLGGDKLILGFEYLVSNFGTSIWRSFLSLVIITALFYIAINDCNFDAKSFINFIFPTSYNIDNIFKSGVSGADRVLFLIYKTLQLIMIYEIIKSFRKFSRQL